MRSCPGSFSWRARIDGNSNKLKDVTIYDLGDVERRRIITRTAGGWRMRRRAESILTLKTGTSRSEPQDRRSSTARLPHNRRVSGVGNIFTPRSTTPSARCPP